MPPTGVRANVAKRGAAGMRPPNRLEQTVSPSEPRLMLQPRTSGGQLRARPRGNQLRGTMRTTARGEHHDFTVACGVGFDAEVMDATGIAQKLRWGRLAYLANGIAQTGGIRNVTHEITLDGVQSTMEAAQVFIANFGRMLHLVAPRRSVRPHDGLLDVIVIRASGPLPGLLASWEALLHTELGESSGGRVFRAQAREIRIETEPSRIVETDGSVVGKMPVVASILPGALSVMVPR